ncbi:MAG TPA: DUF4214 domain-containing protein, partial [Gemmataceae bacterium]|nr:DUF4214 domain-containing protein [Gemmataceae bacterium]
IIAGNKATTSPDVSGGVTSQGNNLIGATDGSSGWVSSDLTGTSAAPLNALLAPLGNYGGLTLSMALLPGSQAIDAGNNALIPAGVTTDQRGLPRIVNATVDIGAFESSGFTIAVTSGSDQSTAVSTAFSGPLVVTVTANNVSEPVAGGLLAFTPPASGASAILSASSAAISADGAASVTATANSSLGSYNVSATASGITTAASFSLTNLWTPTFGDLTSPTIVYGTPTTTLTGHIGSGTAYPTGSSVSITLDSVTQTALIDGSGNFSSTFTTASLGVAGSPYPVTYVFAGNATFTTATDSSTTLTVSPATATVVVTPYSVTYDGLPHTATITSITGVNGETGAIVGTVTLNTTHTNAGIYSSDSWSFTGAGNYSNIASTTITDSITPATLTISANDDSKTYGTVKTFGTTAFTETGLATANGDTITGVSETSTGAPASATAGSYPIVAGAATGSGLSNYTIFYVNGTLTVNPATLTITANDDSKTYGTVDSFSSTAFTETGLVTANGDTITGVTETSTGAPASAAVAMYPIVASAATGSGLSSYTIDYVNGTLTVNAATSGTVVASSANPSLFGQTVTFTATVTAGSGTFDNGGTVQFAVDGTNFGAPVSLTGGQAITTDAALSAGSHTITATYSGDTNFNGSSAALAGGQTVQLVSGQISGTVFGDNNLNGQQDSGELGLAGQTVFLDLNNTGVFAAGDPTATTTANGAYSLNYTGLAPGTYTVRQVLLGGVLLSAPSSGSYSLTLGSQTSFTNQNFGDVLTSIGVPLTLPPSTAFPAQGNANADYVEAIYRAILDRNADAGGLTFWVGVLNNGSFSHLEVVQGIRNSPEHFTQEVDAFYQTLLGRAADATGQAYWVGQLEKDLAEEKIAAAFLNSPEYLSLGDKHFVDAMYESLLGRSFDANGEAFWLSQLGDNTAGNPVQTPLLTHAQVVTDFLYSTESLERLVEGYYEVFLQRQADPQGLNFWVAELQQGLPFLTIGQEFVASDEFYARAAAHG